jgi:alpha-glucoside transport system substrate-binding protein
LAVVEYFTKGEHLKVWMEQGGAIAPHKDADLSWYGSEIERGIAKIIQDATSVRFDGSDLMPGQVGAGSFWKEMTSYVAGAEDLDTALKNIDASWPK